MRPSRDAALELSRQWDLQGVPGIFEEQPRTGVLEWGKQGMSCLRVLSRGVTTSVF